MRTLKDLMDQALWPVSCSLKTWDVASVLRRMSKRVVEAKAGDVESSYYLKLCNSYLIRTAGRYVTRGDLGLYGQANKRTRWMPWRSEAMKDVAACEKYRGAGNKL